MKTRHSIGKTLPMLYIDLVWSAYMSSMSVLYHKSGISGRFGAHLRKIGTF
jgi:hypothetical protein